MDDLWPEDLTQIQLKAPVTVLKEQAELLAQKTEQVVSAEVRPETAPLESPKSLFKEVVSQLSGLSQSMSFRYGFYIKAPGLGNYRHRLFAIIHDIRLYPVAVEPDPDIRAEIAPEGEGPPPLEADSEEAFRALLKQIFGSKKCKQIIRAILSQSATL